MLTVLIDTSDCNNTPPTDIFHVRIICLHKKECAFNIHLDLSIQLLKTDLLPPLLVLDRKSVV